MPNAPITTKCCIAGGGPAGVMLGFLLARAGVDVVVLEKHADFFRDFRGDTIHPSTLELMYELGLLDAFLKLPHQKLESLTAQIGDARIKMVDLTHLPTHCKYIALMPQWDFLNFIAAEGKHYKSFDPHMQTEATDLIEEGGRVVGVRAHSPAGEFAIRADLVVGADGRHSTVREKAGLVGDNYGAPMDVLWFRLPRKQSDETETFGHVEAGMMMIMLNRGDYWQCAFVIPKGGIDRVKAAGLDAFHERVTMMSPYLADRVGELKTWDDIKLLSVAVAAANRLAAPLRAGTLSDADLAAIQARRTLPVRFTQALQLTMQKRLIGPVLAGTQRPKPPFVFRLFDWFPVLRRIPGRLLAVGIRPEHIHTPDVLAGS